MTLPHVHRMRTPAALAIRVLLASAASATCGGTVAAGPDAGTTPVWAPGVDGGTTSCGSCAGSCFDGRCILTFASTAASPDMQGEDIAVDSTSVYWTNAVDGTVLKAPVGGGTVTTLASGQGDVMGVTVDSTSVYFTRGPAVYPLVGRVPLQGGPVTTLSCCDDNMKGPVAVDSASVYWVQDFLASAPLDGGTPATVSTACGAFSVHTTGVACTSWGINPYDGSILDVPKGGGAAVTLASGQAQPFAVASDAQNAYWLNEGTSQSSPSGLGTVMRAALADGSPVTLASGVTLPWGLSSGYADIAVDAANVYFATGNWSADCNFPCSGAIMRVPIGGGTPVTVVALQAAPFAIAINATSAYWISASGVYSVTPK